MNDSPKISVVSSGLNLGVEDGYSTVEDEVMYRVAGVTITQSSLYAALDRLSDRERQVLGMRFRGGDTNEDHPRTYKDIGEELGISASAIGCHARLGRITVKNNLAKDRK